MQPNIEVSISISSCRLFYVATYMPHGTFSGEYSGNSGGGGDDGKDPVVMY